MKKVGEVGFASIPRPQLSRDFYKAAREKVMVKCVKCGVESKPSQGVLAKYHKNGYVCFLCNKQGRDEIYEARLALAKRKLEMKK